MVVTNSQLTKFLKILEWVCRASMAALHLGVPLGGWGGRAGSGSEPRGSHQGLPPGSRRSESRKPTHCSLGRRHLSPCTFENRKHAGLRGP